MMGLEEHLLGMFRNDFEFHEDAAPSHLGSTTARANPAEVVTAPTAVELQPQAAATVSELEATSAASGPTWAADAEKELRKIPFFVRGKAKRNTERYANDQSVAVITVETLYEAKAHYSR